MLRLKDFTIRPSLQSRLAVGVSLLFFVITATGGFIALSYFQDNLKETIANQQQELVTVLARQLDEDIAKAQKSLVDLAALLPEDRLGDKAFTQRLLERLVSTRPFLKAYFDSGVSVHSAAGRLIAEYPYDPSRVGLDLSFREYYRKTVESGRPCISKPYLTLKSPPYPVVIFTAPVFDASGKMTAFLGGRVNLTGENVMGKFINTRIGRTGYLYLFNTDRTLILHADKKRIMEPNVPAGKNRFFDASVLGFEGTMETFTTKGLHTLSTSRRLRTTDWILAANFPVAEAYAAVYRMKKFFFWYLAASVTVTILLIVLLTRRHLASLVSLAGQIREIGSNFTREKGVFVPARDEVGEIARSFNQMMDQLRAWARILEENRNSLQEKTSRLEELNSSLEQRVRDEMARRRQQEQLLIQQSKMAAMGEMISAISHQWRQPLNAVAAIVQGMKEAERFGELDRAYIDGSVDQAMQQIRFMSKTIDDFRTFFRPSKEKVSFDSKRAVSEVLSMIGAQLTSNRISCVLTCGSHDAAAADSSEGLRCGPAVVSGYPNEFKQAVLNIVSNARDAIQERRDKGWSGDGRIVIDFSRRAEKTVISVGDNGGGVRADVVDKIFQPYFTTKGERKGTGIGLYMSKVIVEDNMGGSLTVRNCGEGAVFTIEFAD